MDGKQYFIVCCNEYGIDCDELFKLGRGTRGGKTRFEYSCNPRTRKDSQIFAIKYFEEENLYIAWSLKVIKAKGKQNFTLQREKVNLFGFNEIGEANKPIEYSGHGEEIVYIFSPKGVKAFLNSKILVRKGE